MPFPALPTQVNCPQCREPFVVQVHSVIDIGEEPELKEAFLRGRVNFAECPKCGMGGILSAPLLYHDPEKELLISYVPSELVLPNEEQEKLVGGLVNAVMNSVPQEERKAYFLQPRTALTLDSLYDAILEADGYSKEMLEAQRQRLQIINTLLTHLDDVETLDQLVEEHRADLNYEFLLMLSELIDRHREDGDTERAERVQNLRSELLKRIDLQTPQAAPQDASYDDLIEMLLGTDKGAAWRQTISLNASRLDYGFYQALTAKIEAAEASGDTETVEQLTDLRTRILEEVDARNRVIREAEDEASLLIMTLSEAEDLEAALKENAASLNQVFFAVLTRYIQTAQAQGLEDRVERLSKMLEAATETLEAELPPDLRLLNQLVRAEHPDGTSAVLEANRGLLTDDLVKTVDTYIESLQQEQDQTLVEHLTQVRAQIVAKMTILRA